MIQVERDFGARGTRTGLDWVKRNIGCETKWIEVRMGHVDGMLTIIKPGLLMTWKEEYIPRTKALG